MSRCSPLTQPRGRRCAAQRRRSCPAPCPRRLAVRWRRPATSASAPGQPQSTDSAPKPPGGPRGSGQWRLSSGQTQKSSPQSAQSATPGAAPCPRCSFPPPPPPQPPPPPPPQQGRAVPGRQREGQPRVFVPPPLRLRLRRAAAALSVVRYVGWRGARPRGRRKRLHVRPQGADALRRPPVRGYMRRGCPRTAAPAGRRWARRGGRTTSLG